MPKLINIGSMCIDYVYSVPTLVRSGETVASTARSVFAGGKGLNQSIAAARAGATVLHFGAVGDDGDLLTDTLRQEAVDIRGVVRSAEASGHAIIQVDSHGQNAIVIAAGANRQLTSTTLAAACAAVQAGDWLLLQNETNDVAEAIRLADQTAARVALNLAPADARSASYPIELLDLLIVNEAEGKALSGCVSTEQAFTSLIDEYPRVSTVLTRGEAGLLCYAGESGERDAMPAHRVDSVDETAAGDAFVGYLLAGLVGGCSLFEGLFAASAAGALAVTKAGAAPSIPRRDEVAQLVREQPLFRNPNQ